jgi:hypothetical protein
MRNCQQHNKHWGATEGGNFLQQLGVYRFLKNGPAPWSRLLSFEFATTLVPDSDGHPIVGVNENAKWKPGWKYPATLLRV